jgi:hypothetical protein
MNQRYCDDVPDTFPCNCCPKVCSTLGGLARHKKIKHPAITPPKEYSSHTRFFHPTLNGMPTSSLLFLCSYGTTARSCDGGGVFLQAPWDSTLRPTPPSQDDQRIHKWTPFEDRLAFDWAYYHYVTLQSSASNITEGLNLWLAASIKNGSATGGPWRNAKEMYVTIDSIQTGSLPFKSFKFHYSGPKPLTPPHWMEQTYELNTRDVLAVVREQLGTANFSKQFDYVPYKEFNGKGERLWSNLMSGHWAFMQAVRLFLFIFLFVSHFILGHSLARPMQPWCHVCPYCCGKR